MTLLLPVVCLFACALSIGFESQNQNSLTTKTKFLASLAFVGFAWEVGAMNSTYGQVVFIGLVLSLIGDVLLALKDRKHAFLIGIGAFLLAHISYTVAFASYGFNPAKLPLIVPVVMMALSIIGWWLRKHLTGIFTVAVPAYLIAIGVMLVVAWSNQSLTAGWWIVIGATLFAVSDLWVARNRFINSDIINRIIGLPIYYTAQLMLAYSVSLSL